MDEGIVLVNHDEGEWVALYVDGEKVVEGHSLSESQILEALGCEFTTITTNEDSPWADDVLLVRQLSEGDDYDELD